MDVFLMRKTDVLRTSIFQFKKFVSRSAFNELQLRLISLNFKTSYCNLTVRGWGKTCVFFYLCLVFEILNRTVSSFSRGMTLFNITHDRTGTSKFPYTVLQSFMITSRVRYDTLKKIDF